MGSLALTFDDGPDPVGTPAVLESLAAVDARASFFVVGPLAERHPDLVRTILDAGHAVGVHCDEHVRHTDRDSNWVIADLARALGRLAALGVRPALWRLPWGVHAPWSEGVARRAGLRIVDWSVDTHDWRGDRAGPMLDATRPGLRDGAIVLAHDGIGPGARRVDARETARYVTLAARVAAERGLTLTPLRPSS